VTGLAVRRWRKFGFDRLYVETSSGEDVGWLDVVSGHRQMRLAEYAEEFDQAVRDFLAAKSRAAQPTARLPTQRAGAAGQTGPRAHGSDEAKWDDLAANVAGATLRAKAADFATRMSTAADSQSWHSLATEQRDWTMGAQGEEYVGTRLPELGPHGWRWIHSIPLGTRGADIDHLLVGPGGVIALNTKNLVEKIIRIYQYKIYIDGASSNYLIAARKDAKKAAEILSQACGFEIQVMPALVFLTGPTLPTITTLDDPGDLLVMNYVDLTPKIAGLPVELPVGRRDAIFAHARRSTTWPGGR